MFKLTDDEGRYLVRLARETITAFLRSKNMPKSPSDAPSKLNEKCGVFVTLNTISDGHELRGCIGFPMPDYPLVDATMQAAIEAATGDPRFPHVSLEELQKIVIEVSVLTPPETLEISNPSEYPKRIKIGTDGLIVESGIYKGLLLPQVAVEWDWNEEEFLSQCCLKAGLPPDAWLVRGTRISKFQAIVFKEEKPGGQTRRQELKKGDGE
jgi:uncharacterized protein (TIGR00296 family)